jgi:hypothetical protein
VLAWCGRCGPRYHRHDTRPVLFLVACLKSCASPANVICTRTAEDAELQTNVGGGHDCATHVTSATAEAFKAAAKPHASCTGHAATLIQLSHSARRGSTSRPIHVLSTKSDFWNRTTSALVALLCHEPKAESSCDSNLLSPKDSGHTSVHHSAQWTVI